jgi:hypothetical protein
MKRYEEWRYLLVFLTLAVDGGGQLHAQAPLCQRKSPKYPLNTEEKRPTHPAHSLISVLTELPQLKFLNYNSTLKTEAVCSTKIPVNLY